MPRERRGSVIAHAQTAQGLRSFAVPPTSTDPSVFLRESCAHYGKKSKREIALQEAWQVLQLTGSMHAVRITLGKLRKNSSLRTVVGGTDFGIMRAQVATLVILALIHIHSG